MWRDTLRSMLRGRRRSVRATFLLQLVICVAALAMVATAVLVLLAMSLGTVAIGVVLLVIVLFAPMLRSLADALEYVVLWRAKRTGKPLNPRWFIDERRNA